jgi:hypothetical protein
MGTFDDLGVTPELAEALAAEGIEVPTELQEAAIPLLLRGNSLLAQAGSGAGTLVTYGIPLLQTLDPDTTSPCGLVLAPTPEAASSLATSLSRLSMATGHRIAALGAPWALSEMAGILFATPEELLAAVRESRIVVEEVRSVVVDGFTALSPRRARPWKPFSVYSRERAAHDPWPAPHGRRRSLRQGPPPPGGARAGQGRSGRNGACPSPAGEVHYRVVGEAKETVVLQAVATKLDEGVLHVLLFLNTEDQAADLGDFLAIHGYLAGAPGDPAFPVWLAVEELEARKVLAAFDDPESVVAVSVDVPFGRTPWTADTGAGRGASSWCGPGSCRT